MTRPTSSYVFAHRRLRPCPAVRAIAEQAAGRRTIQGLCRKRNKPNYGRGQEERWLAATGTFPGRLPVLDGYGWVPQTGSGRQAAPGGPVGDARSSLAGWVKRHAYPNEDSMVALGTSALRPDSIVNLWRLGLTTSPLLPERRDDRGLARPRNNGGHLIGGSSVSRVAAGSTLRDAGLLLGENR